MADNTIQLTKAGAANVKKGSVLGFDQDGERKYYRVTRKLGRTCWLRETQLYKPDALTEHEGHDVDQKASPMRCKTCKADLA